MAKRWMSGREVCEKYALTLKELCNKVRWGDLTVYNMRGDAYSKRAGEEFCFVDILATVFESKEIERVLWGGIIGAASTAQVQKDVSPQDVINELRANGVTDLKLLAAEIDRRCPGLTDSGLGKLLPAKPGTIVSWDAQNSQGRRLRGKKKS